MALQAMGGACLPRLQGSALPLSHSEPCMGTLFTVRAFHPDETQGYAAIGAAFQRMHALDTVLSDYRPGNELDRLCQQGHEKPFSASPDLYTMLQRALRVAQETQGAFDPTLGPLTRLWRASRKQQRIPDPDTLADAKARTGWQGIAMKDDTRTIRLPRAGMHLDFGAIAKGYAADEARRVLQEHGVEIAYVAAGGDVAALLPPEGRAAWTVALETGENPQVTVALKEQAVSTSGDLRQFVENDGVRYSHVLHPETGIGLTTRTIVSVVAEEATDCDSFSTAFSVMGRERARELLARKHGMEARFVTLRPDGPDIWQTPGFPIAAE
jgi:thiamine biosynthesis lipoprotein